MRRRHLSWIVAALVSCGGSRAAVTPTPAPSVRVVTYNIFAGNDLERRSNLARVAALIDSLRPDVVMLQEVDRRTARSGGVDQAGDLAARTGYTAVFGRSMDFDGGEYGNALLSRWPVTSSRVVPLDVTIPPELASRSYEPRSLLHAVVATPAGALHVLTTHLDHRSESVFRPMQLLRALAYIADSVPRDAPMVLGGDLNARPDASEVRGLRLFFQDAWAGCGSGPGYTFRSDRPDRRIDYVLLSGAECVSAYVVDQQISDHLPLIVDLRPRPERQ